MSSEKSKKMLSLGVHPSKMTMTLNKQPAKAVGPLVSSPSSFERQRRSTVYGGKSVLASSSRRLNQSLAPDRSIASSQPEVKVLNELNEDVTPRPLLPAVQTSSQNLTRMSIGPVSVSEAARITPTDMSQVSFYLGGGSAITGGDFSRSIFSASQSGRSSDSISDDIGESTADWSDMKVVYKRDEVIEYVPDSELDRDVEFVLSETETIWLLDMPSVSVLGDSEEATIVLQRNRLYQELSKSKPGNDRYADRSMNTFNEALKNKNTQTAKITSSDMSVNASHWDLYDTFNNHADKGGIKGTDEDEELITITDVDPVVAAEWAEGAAPDLQAADSSRVVTTNLATDRSTEASHTTASSSLGFSDSIFGSKDFDMGGISAAVEIVDDTKILNSDAMKRHLTIMERVINLNTYQAKQATYRGLEILPDVDWLSQYDTSVEPPLSTGSTGGGSERPPQVLSQMYTENSSLLKDSGITGVDIPLDIGPNVDRLFSYQCSLTKGRNVSCISWNKTNADLVAVGYGQFEYSKQKEGLICCWSLKNPEYPERVYSTPVGVMSVDFSLSHPNLLAAGLYNGSIVIYNVATSNTSHVLDSFDAAGKHAGPVWRLRWIMKDQGSKEEKIEVLVSISTDGRVTQWTLRKGFESYDLMKLKRVQAKQAKAKKSEALISKFAGGLCFDFSNKDTNLYLAGTEDGHIHKCSCSYNEQYLDSYFGHTGPVYGLLWSPFDTNVFLSCSADWSIRLWHQDRTQPVINLFSSTKAVSDICWSPFCSTVFACVNEGAMEIWDLNQNMLDPILQHTPMSNDIKLSSLSFSHNSDCLLVGDSEGQVTVYQLRGMPRPHINQEEALHRVIQSALQVN